MQTQALTLTAGQAAIIALWISIVMTRSTGFSSTAFRYSPLMTGLVVGVVMGNVPEAMMVTAAIQLIYLGVISPGGSTPSEPAVATAIAVPVALLSGMEPTEAVTVAIPVGLLGSYLYQFRFFLNTVVVTPLVDKYVKETNDRGITFAAIVVPIILGTALFFPATFITLYKGVPLIAEVVKLLSGRSIHVLRAIGGALPAVGIAATLKVIGKKNLMPFFLLAYFLVIILQPLEINTLTFAILGAIISYLYVMVTMEREEETGAEFENYVNEHSEVGQFTDRELHQIWRRWRYINEIPHTFDRMIAFSLLWSLIPGLKKLYKNKEDLRDAYERHAQFFNTECIGGAPIVGIALSLEEQRAKALAEGREEEAVSTEVINGTKVSLMGPFAALGDSIEEGTIQYILIALFLPLANSGNFLGGILPWLIWIIGNYIYGFYFLKVGYKLGLNAATKILSGNIMKYTLTGLSILGLFMMGVLTASYVSVSSPLTWEISGKVFELQAILDSVFPGLLPIAVVMGVYFYFEKKGLNVLKALLWLVVIFAILGVLNII